MRLLLVEDNATFAGEVERAVNATGECDDFVWVRSRDGAISKISAELFDLVILDRKLPSADDVLDDHVDHGWEVFESIRNLSAGTPVWFLTGTEDPDFAADLNNDHARSEDLHGQNLREPMYRVFWKKRIVDCVRKIAEFAAKRKSMERIAVSVQPVTLPLNSEELQAIRLFGRLNSGTAVMVTSLNGGFSNSRVLKVIVKAEDGRVLTTAAAKVSSIDESLKEALRYQKDICRLKAGGFPQLAATINAGAGRIGGLFYGMVGEEVESLFDRIVRGALSTESVPAELRGVLNPWYLAKQIEQVQISKIRRRFISDTVLHEKKGQLEGISIEGIEAKVVRAALCCQHRDMHCANVVFDGRGNAMLIDFGDTGPSYAAVDPVTMELSTIFHSQHTNLPPGWPAETNMLEWPTLARFVANCPFSLFIEACRAWAHAEAGSPEEVVAVGYAYAMRQLKYADTNKQLARALIKGCIQYFA